MSTTVRHGLALAALALPLLVACSDGASPAGLAPQRAPSLASGSGSSGSGGSTQKVELRDDCDSASFNANIGPGACNRRGSVTFTKFIAELTSKHGVGAWWINPDKFGAKPGTALDVTNTGGETHTFTRVANYGGGFVPLLNDLSGNTTVAPECANVDPSTIVPAGGHLHTAQLAAGTYKFQCCIHPWMRSTATIKN